MHKPTPGAEGDPPAEDSARRALPGWLWDESGEGIPADAPLYLLLLAATRVLGVYWAGTVRDTGVRVSPAGIGVLRVLLDQDGLKSSEVADNAFSSPGTLTSVVNGLVREGFVERRRDPADRRVVRLYVTEEGRRVCEKYIAEAGPKWNTAFDFVSPADEVVVRTFFTNMIAHFSHLIRERAK